MIGRDFRGERLRSGRAFVRPRRDPTDRKRVKTYVRGFDDILGSGIPEGYVVLVSGAPGTM
ncbi:MAG TPA: ATPase domain-containing protein, partial [Thermoplasmata archaeon]|nr:ATPase domain-containing protein [Thermoplasmata archaeon]